MWFRLVDKHVLRMRVVASLKIQQNTRESNKFLVMHEGMTSLCVLSCGVVVGLLLKQHNSHKCGTECNILKLNNLTT